MPAISKSVSNHVDARAMTEAIATFVVDTPGDALPESARHIARLSLLDWMAVAIAGSNEPVSKLVRKMVLDDGGTPEATVISEPTRLPARAAAMANGTASHALDYDDTNFVFLGHPSVAVIPAALAIAERTGATIGTFIDAALIGMEATARIGAWLGRQHYEAGFHQTATSGTFGSTMAVARLLGLDQAHALNALGLASTRASGLKSQFGTMGKPFHAGMAAANAVEVATLAAAGFVSNPEGLTCSQGFADTHGGQSVDHVNVLKNLGNVFELESVLHKFHACCHGTHAPIEALNKAQLKQDLDATDIEDVKITVHPRWLGVCDIPNPSTGLEAKFSFRLTAAMALTGTDTSALATFNDGACTDAGLVAVRDRVMVHTDSGLSDTAAKVHITDRKGETVFAEHDLLTPLSRSQRETRVREKAAALLGRDVATNAWEAIGESTRPVQHLFATLT